MDEKFETVTLVQTGKINRPLPMIMFGTEYWDAVLRMEAMVDAGTISATDPDLIFRTDSVDDAFAYITGELGKIEAQQRRS
jgi:predicted Rossmann-fold nucleotide-binding protein